LSTQQDAHI